MLPSTVARREHAGEETREISRSCNALLCCGEKREQSPNGGKPSVPSPLLGKAARIETRDVEGNIYLAEDTVAQGRLSEEKGETTLAPFRAAREQRDHWRSDILRRSYRAGASSNMRYKVADVIHNNDTKT